ncbi:MAG: hypothetical protein CW691_03620 [Candidatus Bathyarchaeum sp.]|nr:MAG: hypothetical protein CW691_03620 [Candidatus Bathyarchaeum sp.]
MARIKHETVKPSVFKGKEAKLNRAIFQVLAQKSPQTAWELFNQLTKQKRLSDLKYWVLIRRIKKLQESDFLMKVGETKTMPGTETGQYQLTPRAELAIVLDQLDLDKFLLKADYHQILTALEAFRN